MKTQIEEILKDTVGEIDASSPDLVEDGYFESLTMVRVISELDIAFDIEIGFDSITKENFSSVDSIEKMVKSYLD